MRISDWSSDVCSSDLKPDPPGTIVEPINRRNAGTSNQKEMLFIRGKAMSGAPIMMGTNQLPKPPTMAGMITKKIMIRPWAVTITFQRTSEAAKYSRPAHNGRYWTLGRTCSREKEVG